MTDKSIEQSNEVKPLIKICRDSFYKGLEKLGYVAYFTVYFLTWYYGVGFVLLITGTLPKLYFPFPFATLFGFSGLITWHLVALLTDEKTPLHLINGKLRLFGWRD